MLALFFSDSSQALANVPLHVLPTIDALDNKPVGGATDRYLRLGEQGIGLVLFGFDALSQSGILHLLDFFGDRSGCRLAPGGAGVIQVPLV